MRTGSGVPSLKGLVNLDEKKSGWGRFGHALSIACLCETLSLKVGVFFRLVNQWSDKTRSGVGNLTWDWAVVTESWKHWVNCFLGIFHYYGYLINWCLIGVGIWIFDFAFHFSWENTKEWCSMYHIFSYHVTASGKWWRNLFPGLSLMCIYGTYDFLLFVLLGTTDFLSNVPQFCWVD